MPYGIVYLKNASSGSEYRNNKRVVKYIHRNYSPGGNNKYDLVDDKNLATTWDTVQKASSVLKMLKRDILYMGLDLTVKYISAEKGTEGQSEGYKDSPDVDFVIKDEILNFVEFYRKVTKQKQYLSERHSRLDQEQEDLLHAIEFRRENAPGGYILYKQLHDLRVERRQCKNDLQYISILEEAMKGVNVIGMKQKIDSFDNKKYKPRVRKDLFEGDEKGQQKGVEEEKSEDAISELQEAVSGRDSELSSQKSGI